MKNKLFVIFLITIFLISNFSIIGANICNVEFDKFKNKTATENNYGIQWMMNFGDDSSYSARYEGPHAIGDCDNDGDNELIIGGRDSKLRILEWDEELLTYFEKYTLHCPYYPKVQMDADGFDIGDLTGDGNNEIAVSWYATIHHWTGSDYKIRGFNTWLEDHGGGSPDCIIGDCDNDGKNEFILSCRPWYKSVPEIVVFEWNGIGLIKEAEWDDPGRDGAVFMAEVGDADNDMENEIILGTSNKVVVLDWEKQSHSFVATTIKYTSGWENYPFACICEDSDLDGENEIHVGYHSPKMTIFEMVEEQYVEKCEMFWPGEGVLIESLDVGDVDSDGIVEVCAGTDLIHILQWNGTDYVEEVVLSTFGDLAVLNIGDCDNDGENEIHAGSVMIDHGQDYMSWVFKYNWESNINEGPYETGGIEVKVKNEGFGNNINGATVAAWHYDSKVWYDLLPNDEEVDNENILGNYERYDIPEGEYLLRAVIEGYKSEEALVNINSGEITNYQFDLERKSKGVQNIWLWQFLLRIIEGFDFVNELLNGKIKI